MDAVDTRQCSHMEEGTRLETLVTYSGTREMRMRQNR